MEMKDSELRQAALNEAARHRLGNETAADVVKNAQQYYEFLRGDKDKKE